MKRIVSMILTVAMFATMFSINAFAYSYASSGTIRFEAEANDVYTDYQGSNAVIITDSSSASGGKHARTDIDDWTWSFTPTVTATYRFELFAAGGGGGEASWFAVGDTKVYTGEILGAPNNDWTITNGKTTVLGDSIELKAGKTYQLWMHFDGNSTRVLDYIDIYWQTSEQPETDILLNAVKDFDREAGPDVGYYDGSPDKVETDCDPDPDNIDIWPANGSYGQSLWMAGMDWFRYTVNVPREGYYRVLLGLKAADADLSVTVNDTETNIVTTRRTNNAGNWVSNPYPYDNAGLFYFNKGDNTIKVAKISSAENCQLYEVRVVSPDIRLTKVEEKYEKLYIEDCGEGNYKGNLELKNGVNAVNMAGPKKDGYGYASWTVNFPVTGDYKVYLNMIAGYGSNKGHIEIDGTAVTATVEYTSGAFVSVDMGTVNISAGEHVITYAHDSYGNQTFVTGITYVVPQTDADVSSVNAGTYKAIVDATDWYAGTTHNTFDTTHGEMYIPWSSTSDEISKLAVIAAVYDGDNLVNAYFSNTIVPTINASNSNLTDYKITIPDIAVADGQKVKLFVYDSGDMTPLADYIIYE